MRQFELVLNVAMVVVGLVIFGSVLTTLDVPARDSGVVAADIPSPPDADADTPTPSATTVTGTVVLTSQLTFATPSEPNATATPTITPLPAAAQRSQWFGDTPGLTATLNIVLLGSDRRPGDDTWRTDTIIVVAIDPASMSAGVIGVPRDMWVDIPDHAPNRVNTLDEFGGPALLKQVLGEYLGMPIDYYVRVDFDGFQKAIDVLGGVSVSVECALSEGYPDPGRPDGIRHVYFPAGRVQMDGQMALDFSRSRLSTSVYDRMRRQLRVLLGVREKLLSADTFARIPELWDAAGTLVQTDIPARDILPLAKLGSQMQLANVHALTIDLPLVTQTYSPQGWWILVPDESRIHAAVRNLFAAPGVSSAVNRQGGCG